MATDTISLPKDHKALAYVIAQHAQREEARSAWYRTKWLLAFHYLNGARTFRVFNVQGAEVSAHFLDDEGNLEFQSQELLYHLDKIQGQIAGLDLRPKVGRNGLSLSAMREKAVGQIIADSVVDEDQLDKVKTQFAQIFTALGSCGIHSHLESHPMLGLTAELEVVHPRELFPFPSLGADYTKQRGIMRQRYVPMEFLEERFGKAKVAAVKDKMDWWSMQIGERVEAAGAGPTGSYTYSSSMQGDPKGKSETAAVRVRELWMLGPRNTCIRYVVTSGEHVFIDEAFEVGEVYCPLAHGRFFETGHFHGAGAFDLLFSQCRALERLLKSLYNNVRDVDRYGVLVLPEGQFQTNTLLREVGNGLKVLPWMPDPVTEGFKPFAIQPATSNDFPGKVASFAKSLVDGLSPFRDLAAEKGRIDSGSGLQFLNEQIGRLMNTPTQGLSRIFGDAYRSVVSQAATKLTAQPQPLPVSRLTLDLAGAVIDPDDNTVNFTANPLPNVHTLTFSVKETTPKSEAARISGGLQLVELQICPPDKFLLMAIKEGLDLPMWLDDYRAAYDTIVRNCLLIYGDGVSPNPDGVWVAPHTSKPEVQLLVLEAFMTSPAMQAASPDVVDEFRKYREFLMTNLGLTLPAAVPNPDDAAILTQTEQVAANTMLTGKPPTAVQKLIQNRMMPSPQGIEQ